MYKVESTYQIVVLKALNRSVDKVWVNWAYQMLQAGYETEHLIILAGENPPYNQFELKQLTDKVFTELNINYTDALQAAKNYATHLVEKALKGEIDAYVVLEILKQYYFDLPYGNDFRDFYELYYLTIDIQYCKELNLNEDDVNNLKQSVVNYFKEWLAENQLSN